MRKTQSVSVYLDRRSTVPSRDNCEFVSVLKRSRSAEPRLQIRRVCAVLIIAAITTACSGRAAESFTEQSATCGVVTGPTEVDVNRALLFCQAVAPGMVQGVHADESVLRIKITRDGADEMRADNLTAEQLVKTWMRGWKMISQRNVVVVNVDWEDVRIAEGSTTMTGRDEVTIR
jgi:hypothetical protein